MARINNLNNFLTDVADAIKSKKGSQGLIPAANFDTEIVDISTGKLTNEEYSEAQDDLDNILENTEVPSGTIEITENGIYDVTDYETAEVNVSGGETIKTYSQFKSQIDKMANDFNSIVENRVNLYPVYTENPITLYTPGSGNKYIIHKRSNDKYRIIWSKNDLYGEVVNNTTVGFIAMSLKSSYYNTIASYEKLYKVKVLEDFKLIEDFMVGTMGKVFYYSNEFDTIEELITAISSPDGNISYTEWTKGSTFGAVLDSPYEITFSNVPIFDARNNYEFLMTRKISANETYEVIT